MTKSDLLIFERNASGILYTQNCIDTCCLGRGLSNSSVRELHEVFRAVTGRYVNFHDTYSAVEINQVIKFLGYLKK